MQYKNTVNTRTHITKTSTQLSEHILPKHPHNCQNTDTLQKTNIHTPTNYKAHAYAHQHIETHLHIKLIG